MAKHLFLALSTKGFGETILGVRLATALQAFEDSCSFLSHPASSTVLDATPFPYTPIADHTGPLLELYVDAVVARQEPSSIILSDFFTTDLWFNHHGIDRGFLWKYEIPVMAIDTWIAAQTGSEIDIYWKRRRQFEDWTGELDLLLQPTPIAQPTLGANAYSALPEAVVPSPHARLALRNRLSLRPSDKVVLFCTAEWQQTEYACPHAQRLAATVPTLIAEHLDMLDDDVHLLHVGPRPYDALARSRSRYHWMSSTQPTEFGLVLAGSDLLMSANISATTIARAMASGIPTLVLVNSYTLAEPSLAADLPFLLNPDYVEPWLLRNCPIFAYYMWPVGYYEFLQPVLRDSEYVQAMEVAEILDAEAVTAAVEGLLFHESFRSAALARQSRYVDAVRRLPSPAELVRTAIAS